MYKSENKKDYPATVTHPGCANDLSQVDVHPIVTAHQVPIVGFSIFQLHQLVVIKKTEI